MSSQPGALDRRPPPPYPFTILTGFLGAGKTTLLNRLLGDPALADTLVLVNEFGEAGLDHLLIEKVDGDMMLLASGCVCCTVRGELVDTLEDVLRRVDNGRMQAFRRVIVETTGLADPAPLLHTIMNHPYLRLRFQLAGVIAVVDAITGAGSLDGFMEAVKQAAMADRIVLTKTDLDADGAATAALRERLAALNPGAPILDAMCDEAGAAQILDAGLYDPQSRSPRVRQWLNAEAFSEPLRAASAAARGVSKHESAIKSFVVRRDEPVESASLSLFMDMLRQLRGASLLRVKGIVRMADDPERPLVIHGVQHVFHPASRLDAWPDADHSTRIVFIVRDLDPAHVRGLWQAFNGGIAVDAPDAAALTDNPLKPVAGGLLG